MTSGISNTHDTRTRNRRHKSTPFSGAGFWYVCHANLGLDSSAWYQILVPNRTLFYSKPETGVRVTEMMIYHRLLFIFVISCKQSVNSVVVIYFLQLFIVYVAFSHVYFQCQKFSFQMYMVGKTGARKWSRFMAPVSVACAMGISL